MSPRLASDPFDSGIARYNEKDYPAALDCFNRCLALKRRHPDALLFRALTHHMLGKRQEALADIRAALRAGPEDASLRLAAVGVFKSLGFPKEALKQAEWAVKLGGGADAWAVRAEMELDSGDREAARESFEKAAGLGIVSAMLRSRAAVFFEEEAQQSFRRYLYTDAERDFNRSVELDPLWRKAHLGLGELCRMRSRVVDAIKHLTKAAGLEPVDPLPFFGLAELHAAAGRRAEAEEALRKAVAAGSSARARVLLGRLLLQSGDEAGARKEFESAVAAKESPGDNPQEAAFARLEALMRLKNFAEAFSAADELFRAEPTQDRLWSLVRALGLPERAVARPSWLSELEAHVAASPEDAWARMFCAYALDRVGESAAARACAEKLRKAPKKFSFTRYILGELLVLNHCEYEAALAELRAAYAGFPGVWNAKALECEILLCQGKEAEALAGMDELVKSSTGSVEAEAAAWRGEFHLWSGRYKKALADFDFGLRGGARFARTWRGAARLLLGKFEEAEEDLKTATEVDPSDTEAWIWTVELFRRTGRREGALKILERADCRNDYWGILLRAVLHSERGDEKGLAEAVEALPDFVRKAFDEADARASMDGILKRAKGLRRGDPHLARLWTPG